MSSDRLDVRLARLTGLSRSLVERLIKDGRAMVDGTEETKPGRKVDANSDLSLDYALPETPGKPEAEPITLDIVYEDNDIAVIDKPCGMVVHPGAGNTSGTLVNALLHNMEHLSTSGGLFRPGIVHRLDKDTSGLLLVAKNNTAHERLSVSLKQRAIQRIYKAAVHGTLKQEDGFVEAPIARHPSDRKRMTISMTGRYARTEYRLESSYGSVSLVTVKLITGRTHQIRVHFASIGHPVLGDSVYGGKKNAKTAKRLMLHAWKLELIHPVTGKPLQFISDPPAAFQAELVKYTQSF